MLRCSRRSGQVFVVEGGLCGGFRHGLRGWMVACVGVVFAKVYRHMTGHGVATMSEEGARRVMVIASRYVRGMMLYSRIMSNARKQKKVAKVFEAHFRSSLREYPGHRYYVLKRSRFRRRMIVVTVRSEQEKVAKKYGAHVINL
jgi:hypothetical protein